MPEGQVRSSRPAIEGGVLSIDQGPGAGFALQWDKADSTAAERFTLRA